MEICPLTQHSSITTKFAFLLIAITRNPVTQKLSLKIVITSADVIVELNTNINIPTPSLAIYGHTIAIAKTNAIYEKLGLKRIETP